jgi:uncharacterized membrane protein
MEGETPIIDNELRGAALLIIAIIGILLVVQPLYAGRTVEAFSELAILGPNQKIGDYPKDLQVGESFSLYLYVGNHEGQSQLYRVYAKLGDRTSIISENTSLAAEPLAHYDIILQNNQTWLEPITLQINTQGTNLRLTFELWTYSQEANDFRYYNRWNQLWLNVTRPR